MIHKYAHKNPDFLAKMFSFISKKLLEAAGSVNNYYENREKTRNRNIEKMFEQNNLDLLLNLSFTKTDIENSSIF